LETKKSTGNWGEQIAAEYLFERGHQQIIRNWRLGHLEIDVLSIHDGILHVTEVKTRLEGVIGKPSEWLSFQQQSRLVEAAHQFILTTRWEGDTQFNLLAIASRDPLIMEYIPNAFTA
jgi:putative endonuclease